MSPVRARCYASSSCLRTPPETTEGPGLALGEFGTGELWITDGGDVEIVGPDALFLAGRGNTDSSEGPISGYGQVSLVGPGSTLLVDSQGVGGTVHIGDDHHNDGGDGVLQITGGASATFNAEDIALASGGFSTAFVAVAGPGSDLTLLNGDLKVGARGFATLDIREGAAVESFSDAFGGVVVGAALGSFGIISVSGPGTSLSTNGAGSVIRMGAAGGTGEMTVTDGALVSTTHLEAGQDGNAFLTLMQGAQVEISASLGTAPGFSVASSDTAFGTAVMSDPGTRVTIEGDSGARGFVEVGREGNGILLIEAGAQLLNDPLGISFVGRESAGRGTVLLDGQGHGNTQFDAGAQLIIGADYASGSGTVLFDRGGSGTVEVQAGARLAAGVAEDDSDDIFIGSGGELHLGAGAGVSGDLRIEGGSLVVDSGADALIGDLASQAGALDLTIDSSGTSPLAVSGSVDLAADLISIQFDGVVPAASDSFTFISTGDGLSVDEEVSLLVGGVPQLLNFDVSYGVNDASLEVVGNTGVGDSTIFLGGSADDSFAAGSIGDRFDGGGGGDHFIGGAGGDIMALREGDGGFSLSEARPLLPTSRMAATAWALPAVWPSRT